MLFTVRRSAAAWFLPRKSHREIACAAALVFGVIGTTALAADNAACATATSWLGGHSLKDILRRSQWNDLRGFAADDHREAFALLQSWCLAREAKRPEPRRTAAVAAVAMDRICYTARDQPLAGARAFFEENFHPWRIETSTGDGFLTGYYEPELDGSPIKTAAFTAPVLARPDDLVTLPPEQKYYPGEANGEGAPLTAARRRPDGLLEAYPSRAAIEAGDIAAHTRPLVWLRDAVEVFFVHVQGSARVRLPDGTRLRLDYDGRNGQPYSSIGRIMVAEGLLPAGEATLGNLKDWLRAHAARGQAILQRNRSYIFFSARPDLDASAGPVGGAGVPLQALRAIAIDRHIWCYGLPFWIEAELPWRSSHPEAFRRLMIALDTGSAIVGPARADIFFGSGDVAGQRAGAIRHPGRFFVLLPRDFEPP